MTEARYAACGGKRAWDRYNMFHKMHSASGLVVFQTDQVAVATPNFSSYQRRVYPELGVSIVATNGNNAVDAINTWTFQTAGGELIPKTQLNHRGMQLLFVQNHTGAAVRIDWDSYKATAGMPPHLWPTFGVSHHSQSPYPVGAPVLRDEPWPLWRSRAVGAYITECASHLRALCVLAGREERGRVELFVGHRDPRGKVSPDMHVHHMPPVSETCEAVMAHGLSRPMDLSLPLSLRVSVIAGVRACWDGAPIPYARINSALEHVYVKDKNGASINFNDIHAKGETQ